MTDATDLLRNDARLGTVRDTQLAAEYGVSRQFVSRTRTRKGIPPYRPPVKVAIPEPGPPIASEITRRRLIVAIAQSGRTWKDVAGCSWGQRPAR